MATAPEPSGGRREHDYPAPVRWAADVAKRLLPPRAWPPLVGLLRSWRYLGEGVYCPCCDREFRAFAPHRNLQGVRCPACGSFSRQRLLTLYFRAHPELLAPGVRLLHFAPEYCLIKLFEARPGLAYRTADLDSPLADDSVDITRMPYSDASFDLVLCSHVLEHVEDDRRALGEITRVLRPGGCALLLVPFDPHLAETFEDSTVSDPLERLRIFGQEDHCRVYGRDRVERLGVTGLEVEAERYAASLPSASIARMGLAADEEIYFCFKPTTETQGPYAGRGSRVLR